MSNELAVRPDAAGGRSEPAPGWALLPTLLLAWYFLAAVLVNDATYFGV